MRTPQEYWAELCWQVAHGVLCYMWGRTVVRAAVGSLGSPVPPYFVRTCASSMPAAWEQGCQSARFRRQWRNRARHALISELRADLDADPELRAVVTRWRERAEAAVAVTQRPMRPLERMAACMDKAWDELARDPRALWDMVQPHLDWRLFAPAARFSATSDLGSDGLATVAVSFLAEASAGALPTLDAVLEQRVQRWGVCTDTPAKFIDTFIPYLTYEDDDGEAPQLLDSVVAVFRRFPRYVAPGWRSIGAAGPSREAIEARFGRPLDVEDSSAPEEEALVTLERDELSQRLSRARARLTPKRQQAIEIRLMAARQGETERSLCERLHLSYGAHRQTVGRAIDDLRVILAGDA